MGSIKIEAYAYIKIGTDILLVISGIFMGGVFGIGTIVSALSTGILVMKFAKIIKHFQGDFGVYPEDSKLA